MVRSSGWQGRKEGRRKEKEEKKTNSDKKTCLRDTRRYTSTTSSQRSWLSVTSLVHAKDNTAPNEGRPAKWRRGHAQVSLCTSQPVTGQLAVIRCGSTHGSSYKVSWDPDVSTLSYLCNQWHLRIAPARRQSCQEHEDQLRPSRPQPH